MWSEFTIGRLLARGVFKDGLVVVPNCTVTGHECDLLVVNRKLMLIDVEVKISRADLKADAAKDKWWRHYERIEGRLSRVDPPRHVDWPPKVFMHYYAMPREIWTPDLLPKLGSPQSGVILCGVDSDGRFDYTVERRAGRNPEAKPIAPAALINIARLASLRMWDVFKAQDEAEFRRLNALRHTEADF